jgi:hypothetical protein
VRAIVVPPRDAISTSRRHRVKDGVRAVWSAGGVVRGQRGQRNGAGAIGWARRGTMARDRWQPIGLSVYNGCALSLCAS